MNDMRARQGDVIIEGQYWQARRPHEMSQWSRCEVIKPGPVEGMGSEWKRDVRNEGRIIERIS